jgi:hypothetical protein
LDAFGLVPAARVSTTTLPSGSRRTKSVAVITYSTLGQRCVWTGVVAPVGIVVSSIRTRSFSSRC